MNINYYFKVNYNILWLENEKFEKILKQNNNYELDQLSDIKNQYKIIKNGKSEKPFVITKENFINHIDQNQLDMIECSICLNIMNHPITLCANCDELFCEICISQHLKIKNDCPKCKVAPFIKQNLGRSLKNILNTFQLNCPIECGLKFGFIEIENHKNSCEKLKENYQCSLCDKKLEYQQNLENAHQNECEKLKKSCNHCKEVISVFVYDDHLKTCDQWRDYCENCNLMVCRKYQDAHSSLFCTQIQKLSLLIKKLEDL